MCYVTPVIHKQRTESGKGSSILVDQKPFFAKDCLLNGQGQAYTKIIRLSVVGCHHAKNG